MILQHENTGCIRHNQIIIYGNYSIIYEYTYLSNNNE